MHLPVPAMLAFAVGASACASVPISVDGGTALAGDTGARVRITDGTTVSMLARSLADEATRGEGRGDCAFVLGDAGPSHGVAIAVEGPGLELAGTVLCGSRFEGVLQDPRIHQVVNILEDGGKLFGAHPSGPGRFPLAELAAEPVTAASRLMGIWYERPSSAASAALPLLAQLSAIREHFLFIVWPLPQTAVGDSSSASHPGDDLRAGMR